MRYFFSNIWIFTSEAARLAGRNLVASFFWLVSAVAGTSFAVILMMLQTGFKNALEDSTTSVIDRLDGDLFIVSKRMYILAIPQTFPLRRIEAAAGFAGVKSANPLMIENRRTSWRRSGDGVSRRIRVIAYPPRSDLLDIAEVKATRDAWSAPETALADSLSKPDLVGRFHTGDVSELSRRRLKIVGMFSLGTDFHNDGTLIMSDANLLRYVPERAGSSRGDDRIDIGVIKIQPGYSIDKIEHAIAAILPGDVRVLSKAEFVAKEKRFWKRVAPIGIVFDIGVGVGLIVGMAICYQVLFAEVSDRLAEFATMKAIGHTETFLGLAVVIQSLLLAAISFAVGLAISAGLYRLAHAATGLPMDMRVSDAREILALTIGMCSIAGLLAASRLKTADPAALFK
jgi:putative ABC transport system permease protein